MVEEDKDKPKKESVKTSSSLVFISHDTRDAKLAEAFSGLLKSVSAGVLKSFRTSDRKGNQGIEYGVEWYPEIIKNIQEASDVVCLLTKRSVDRPWILFEAGMAKGKLGTPILGVALGISLKEASSGPFAQFQNCADDEDSLTKLVFQLVDRIPNSEPDENTIKFQVGNFKKVIAEILEDDNTLIDNVAESNDISGRDNSSAKLFEEIKVMFQDLPSRIESNISPGYKNKKRRHYHTKMILDMMHMHENDKFGILIGLSAFKEFMPWVYEVGVEKLRIMDSDKSNKIKEEAFYEFKNFLGDATGDRMLRGGFSSKDDFILLEELPHILISRLDRYMHRKLK